MQDEQLYKLPEVLGIFRTSKATFYRGVAEGRFPAPVKLGGRSSYWLKSDIDNCIAGFIQQSKEEQAA